MTRNVFEDLYYQRAVSKFRELMERPPSGMVEGYEVVDQFRGGMSLLRIVRKDGKLWVLKTAQEIENVAREATALYETNHSLIISVDRVLTAFPALSPYLVLPYCAGGSLRDRMTAARQLPPDEMIYHLLLTAGSLFMTHRLGWVHRDIKPENILFKYSEPGGGEPEWETVAADLGISARAGSTNLAPFFQGTVQYAPPEQLRGAPPMFASDMWSWGVMSVEVITGEHPYLRLVSDEEFESHRELAERVVKAEGEIRQLTSRIEPAWLRDIIESCVSPDPNQRPSSKDVLVAFGDHCKITSTDGPTVGEMGAVGDTPFDYPLSTLGALIITNDLWPTRFEATFIKYSMNVRVLNTIRKAHNYLKAGTEESNDEALNLLNELLGEPDDESSLLFKYITNPSAETLKEPVSSEREGNVLVGTLGVSRWEIEEAIDLKLMALIVRVEDRARQEDLEALSRLTAACPVNRLDQLQDEHVVHWAQAVMHLGHVKDAFAILRIVLDRRPGDLLALATFLSFMLWEGMFEAAYSLLSIIQALDSSDKESLKYLLLRKALYAGTLAGKAHEVLPILVQTIKEAVPLLDVGAVMMYLICLYRAEGAVDTATWNLIKNEMFTIAESNVSLVRMSVMCAWLYQEYDYCVRRSQAALQSRFFILPVNQLDAEFFRYVASGNSPLDYEP